MSLLNNKNIEIDFIDWYIREGFMKTSKKDIDVYALYLICKYNPDFLDKDVYEISSQLKLSQSKVKSYLREIQTRYELLSVKEIIFYLINVLLKGSFEILSDKKEIRIQFNNPLIVDFIKYRLNILHAINDSSFNQNIIKISIDNFAKLIDSICSENNLDNKLLEDLKITLNQINNKVLLDELKGIKGGNLVETLKELVFFIGDNKDQLSDNLIKFWNKIRK